MMKPGGKRSNGVDRPIERNVNMGRYLDSKEPFETYRVMAGTRFFVDKTLLLEDILRAVELDGQKYLCITRPRRFGKSVMANMVAAFLGRAEESGDIFDGLLISQSECYHRNLNQYSVISIDFSEIPENCASYRDYINWFLENLKKDLAEAFPEIVTDTGMALWDILRHVFRETGEKFVFVIDEWDCIFHMSFITEEDKKSYLLFLKSLLKDKVYVKLAYMTGVLPIAKYSSGSELNMFSEYDMTVMERSKNPKITRDDLEMWYDGYYTAAGDRLYNPRSVVNALSNNQLANYWTSSGPYEEIFYFVRNNEDNLRDDLVLMVAGEGVEAEIRNYAAASMELNTKDEIYSAMVIYGLLTYTDGKVFIPNKELMDKFREFIRMKGESCLQRTGNDGMMH